LKQRGYTLKQASAILFQSTKNYHPLIDELLQELIDESPYKGIPVLINRNPSLKQGSILRMFITEFKKDPTISTMDISILIVKPLNADFDGDEINVTILLDNKMAEKAKVFDPHYNIVDLDIFKINGNLNLPNTSLITLTNYLDKKEGEVDNCSIYSKLIS